LLPGHSPDQGDNDCSSLGKMFQKWEKRRINRAIMNHTKKDRLVAAEAIAMTFSLC